MKVPEKVQRHKDRKVRQRAFAAKKSWKAQRHDAKRRTR